MNRNGESGGGGLSVNGTRLQANNFILDGVDNNDGLRNDIVLCRGAPTIMSEARMGRHRWLFLRCRSTRFRYASSGLRRRSPEEAGSEKSRATVIAQGKSHWAAIPMSYDFFPLIDLHAPERDRDTVLHGWFANILPDMNTDDATVALYLRQNTV